MYSDSFLIASIHCTESLIAGSRTNVQTKFPIQDFLFRTIYKSFFFMAAQCKKELSYDLFGQCIEVQEEMKS